MLAVTPASRLRISSLTRLRLAPVAGLVALANARPAQDAPPDRRAEHALERRLDRVCAVWDPFPFFLAPFVRLEFGLLELE
ncbi:hypothetical protein B0H14DRAFT_2744208 [Mycena olivaceomarginata]|nr:hypothetical protein B0H14DRAFT_2744208 [Mycena olivaceomarginata]